MYDVAFEDRRVEKQFNKLQKIEQQQIRDALELLKKDPFNYPFPSDLEKLVGDLKGHWSLHIGRSMRTIYKIDGKTIVIRAVGHHDTYQEFSRYLRQLR